MTAVGQPLLVSTSSSTMPSLMARMLEALDVQDGHRVLEIGTGTGYNAALLCHRLGSGKVVSIDVDPTLVAVARDHLAGLDYHPILVVGDGAAGVARHGPYDRIIATAAVPEIPVPWIEQLTPGGKILANLRGSPRVLGAPGTRRAPAPHSTRHRWSATTASDSCCNSSSAVAAASVPQRSTIRAPGRHETVYSSRLLMAPRPRSSQTPNSTDNARSSRPVRVAYGTAWRPPTNSGATSASPIPAASGLSPIPPSSSSGLTLMRAGTGDPSHLPKPRV